MFDQPLCEDNAVGGRVNTECVRICFCSSCLSSSIVLRFLMFFDVCLCKFIAVSE